MRTLPIQAILAFLILFVSCTPQKSSFQQFLEQQPNSSFDILITNGQVIDGTGTAAYTADVLISNDTIAYIGNVDTTSLKVETIIDATGRVISPGFIDTHAHGDPLETPEFHNFLAQGVTTIILGNDGGSPLNLAEWAQQVTELKPGVNIAAMVGHNTIRAASSITYNPEPTQEQLEELGQMLEEELDAGGIGLSTGLEYLPGRYAPTYELEYLAKIVGKKGKFVASHMRNEDDDAVEESIRELLQQGKYCPVHVSHIKAVYGKGEKRAEEILSLLAEARQEGIQVTADIYPYTASFTGINLIFPTWALPPNDYQQVLATRRKELADYLRNRVNGRNGPEATLIGTAPYAGKTLADLAAERNKPFEDVLIDDIKPGGASAAYFVMDEALQTRLLQDSLVMICSDGSPEMRHPRGYGSFAKVIEEYVVNANLLSLEEAVRKMTSLSAKTMGLTDRGILQPGHKADILIFNPQNVKATATFEEPFQLATGLDWVLINGKVAMNRGTIGETRYGQVLKKL